MIKKSAANFLTPFYQLFRKIKMRVHRQTLSNFLCVVLKKLAVNDDIRKK